MALIKLGSLAQDVRGSQNGLTFSRNKGGAYVRQKVSPVQPNTSKQRAVRQAFSINTKLWSGTMTAAQRAAWIAFATTYPYQNVFGDSSVLTGLAMSVAKNQVLNQLGVAPILDPPPDNNVVAIPDVVSVGVATGGGGITLATAAQGAAADTDYYVFATPGLPPGRNPGESIYRFLGFYPPVAASHAVGVPATIYATFQTSFGAPQVGNIVWFIVAMVSISTGNITVGTKVSAIVA